MLPVAITSRPACAEVGRWAARPSRGAIPLGPAVGCGYQTRHHWPNDIAPTELASYCLHAISGARSLSSKAAVRRLVAVTLAGLRPAIAG